MAAVTVVKNCLIVLVVIFCVTVVLVVVLSPAVVTTGVVSLGVVVAHLSDGISLEIRSTVSGSPAPHAMLAYAQWQSPLVRVRDWTHFVLCNTQEEQ